MNVNTNHILACPLSSGEHSIAKKPTKEGGQFAWQAGCPFHMRYAKTGCKKTMNVNPVTSENYKMVRTFLKAWCN